MRLFLVLIVKLEGAAFYGRTLNLLDRPLFFVDTILIADIEHFIH